MPELVALQTMLPQIDSPVAAQTKALQLRALQNASMQADTEQAARAQALADDRAVRAAYAANPTDQSARLAALAGISPKAYAAEAKQQADIAKSNAGAMKDQLDAAHKKVDITGQAFGYVRNNPTPENAKSAVNWLVQQGVFSPEQGQQNLAKIDADPANVKAMADQAFAAAVNAKDQLLKIETKDNGGALKTIGTNPLTGDVRTLSSMAKVQSPDSRAADARAAADRAAGRNQLIQAETGPLVVNTKTGEARPVTQNGEAVKPTLRPLPAQVQKAAMENDAALRKVDDALKAVDDYPAAFGLTNALGDSIRQRTDPKGVKGRALVADIGSLKLHDRSGAAVTAAETPRLKPFIPAATDSVDTIKEKLGLFKREYEAIQNDIDTSYSPETGYKARTKAAASAAIPSTNSKGWVLHTDASGNKAYVSPDGKQYEEVK